MMVGELLFIFGPRAAIAHDLPQIVWRQHRLFQFDDAEAVRQFTREVEPLAAFGLPLVGCFSRTCLLAGCALWVSYLTILILASVGLSRRRGWRIFMPLMGAFVSIHFAWGLGWTRRGAAPWRSELRG